MLLVDIIPPELRKPIYAVYAVIGVVLGALQVALDPDPSWLITSLAVYTFLGGAIGALASANTNALSTPAGVVETEVEDEDIEI